MLRRLPHALLASLLMTSGMHARANDFPTADRVFYVQECMKANPGPYFEMVNKCSCALDAIASEIKHEEFVTLQTYTNAVSIGGERGSELRDNPTVQPQIKRWRELQAKAQKGCFINPR